MRLDHQIDTPWTVYGVTFSGDGTRLAIGGGTYYGFGGIIMVDLATREHVAVRLADLVAPPEQGGTISGLVFSSDDRHLLASTWSARHNASPTIAMELDGLRASVRASRRPTAGLGTVCGIVQSGERSIVRRMGLLEHAFEIQSWRELVLDRAPPRQHLTGNRLAITHGHAVTGDHGLQTHNQPLAAGLVVRPLDGTTCTHLPAHDTSRITALTLTNDGTLITGGLEGELDLWPWTGALPAQGSRIGIVQQPVVPPDARWITYRPASVVGICSLTDGRLVIVTAGGMLATWRPCDPMTLWQLPIAGSPRSIAAHPDRALVAVGLKTGDFTEPESTVAMIEIEPEEILPIWRTPRVLAMARSADTERKVTFDPIALGVLADALEEAGCDPRVLGHLRSHDRRAHTCWVIDRLLAR